MRIPEENCNMILLAAVTFVSVAGAGAVALLQPAPAQEMAQATPAYLADPTPVRVVGAPFVPNTNPRERH
jgi:hypothetical protein